MEMKTLKINLEISMCPFCESLFNAVKSANSCKQNSTALDLLFQHLNLDYPFAFHTIVDKGLEMQVGDFKEC